MPRNYDEMRAERDLEFVICGQTFKMRLLPASVIGDWEEREDKADLTDNRAFIDLANSRIRDVLDNANGQVERWDTLSTSADGPTFGELADLMQWVLEVQAGIPTRPPAPSVPGRGKTATSSKVASS